MRSGDAGFISANDVVSEKPLYAFLVPDEKFRNVLNKDLEIIVSDTIYSIEKEGTFYAHKRFYEELKNAKANIAEFKEISRKLKRFNNVYLYDSHDLWYNNGSNPITDENYFNDSDDELFQENYIDDEINIRSSVRSHRPLTNKDIEGFETMGVVKPNLLGKILEFTFSGTTYNKYRFKSNKNRKLYVSFYNKDFVVYKTIGFDVKVMKKLWHGLSWGQMINWDAGIYAGFSTIRIENTIKRKDFAEIDNFHKSIGKFHQDNYNKQQYRDFYDAIKQNEGLHYQQFPFASDQGKGLVAIPVFYNNLDKQQISTINKEVEKGLYQGFKQLKNMYYGGNKEAGAYVAFNTGDPLKYTTTYVNMIYFNGGGYRVRDHFLKEYKNIVIGFSFGGGKYSGLNFKSEDVVKCRILQADGIIYTEDGDDWIGVKISVNEE